jgi:hypothetical protein
VSERTRKAEASGRPDKRRVYDGKKGIFIFFCFFIEETFRIAMTKSSGMDPKPYVRFDDYAMLIVSVGAALCYANMIGRLLPARMVKGTLAGAVKD